ncbi:MAG: LamG domain-containing protein [Actinomyces urogenitalis]|uniref:LamG domain-containing protein n=1 Tax=Actinomyces urogenitalis TaxID=103621 RepID=UPI00242F675A|nr:LamG domain-containing protein [Actinomyces urogenitalis]MBS5976442.1 LamG domain-containing protein [Actinomyces urogenitalis]
MPRTTRTVLVPSLSLAVALTLGALPAASATPSTALPVSHSALSAARPSLPEPQVEAPVPDVLDVDLAEGTQDHASGRTVTVYGPQAPVSTDEALGRPVMGFDGSNAIGYDYLDGYEATAQQVTIECTFRFDAPLPGGSEETTGNFCGAKEAGGYSLTVYGSTLKMMVNVTNEEKKNRYFGPGVDIRAGQWYHAVGVWDGNDLILYLNGRKVAQTSTWAGTITAPKPATRKLFIGADTSSTGDPQFNGTVSLAHAGVFSRAVSAQEVEALYAQAFASRTTDQVSFTASSPATGAHLEAP